MASLLLKQSAVAPGSVRMGAIKGASPAIASPVVGQCQRRSALLLASGIAAQVRRA